MIKVLFVCHGNICRSPMAEFVMKDLVNKKGLEDLFEIASAATTSEEIWNGRGNPVHHGTRRKLAQHGISCEGKRARLQKREDYAYYDLIIGMDEENLYDMKFMAGKEFAHKVSLLMDYTGKPHDVADPWYTGDFEETWKDVLAGCTALLDHILNTLGE